MNLKLGTIAGATLLACASAHAGPFILAGTDADDHGSVSAGVNEEGWLFMQRAIENIGAGVTNGNNTLVVLGSTNTGSFSAYAAATSAFSLSSLATAGWSINYVDGAANIASFLQGGAVGAGLIMLDSGGSNVSGGLQNDEEAALAANATFLNSFVGAGGGLFSQANDYSWLSALLPSVVFDSDSDQGLALTAAGNAAFPGLTDADLSAGPYHGNFMNVGSLPVLARGIGNFSNLDVILGASGGSITNPDITPAVPEPSTYALMFAGLAAVGWMSRRRQRKEA